MSDATDPDAVSLTAREREVLEMVAAGMTNREIGTALFITESTAGVHVSNVMAKLGAASRTEAAAMAIRAGIVEPGPGYLAPSPSVPEVHPVDTPRGWYPRLIASIRRERQAHPRRLAVLVGGVGVLLVATVGLTVAVVASGRPAAGVADPSPSPTGTAVPSTSHGGPTTSPSDELTASPSPTATPDVTASASPDASVPSTATTPPVPTPQPIVGSWRLVGSMEFQRYAHTATRLPDGTVLVVGGVNSGGYAPVPELYDPTAERWSSLAPLPLGYAGHTATPLADGRVLVAGGFGSTNDGPVVPFVPRIFDPADRSWREVAPMTTPRGGHTATLLTDGRVLVAGGATADATGTTQAIVRSAEIYDPAADAWTVIAQMSGARTWHTATRLSDGRVLVAGGTDAVWPWPPLRSVEIFDPREGTWTDAAPMSGSRFWHTATLLDDGTVLVAGGRGNLGDQMGVRADIELFSPSTGRWSPGPALGTARMSHSATLLPDGRVLIFGGANIDNVPLGPAEVYAPADRAWLAGGFTSWVRAGHTATLLEDGTVLIAGGDSRGPGGGWESHIFDPR